MGKVGIIVKSGRVAEEEKSSSPNQNYVHSDYDIAVSRDQYSVYDYIMDWNYVKG